MRGEVVCVRILYLDIDSLLPDHLGCYGYHRRTSPNIDGVAAEGVRFENCYATDTPCLPSRTAFFLGQCGTVTGVVNHGGEFADLAPDRTRDFRSRASQTSLASRLRQNGVRTCSISPFPNRHTAYQVWYGFDETHDTGKGGLENADEMFPVAERWLRANGQADGWFLHVNFWDPHTPYDTPRSFGNPFEGDPIEPWLTDDLLARQNASFGPHSATEVPGFDDVLGPRSTMGVGAIRDLADAKRHFDGYDAGIAYADLYLGRLFGLLQDLGIWEETAIVISADHGESHGELNVWGDHQTADQACNRIPLIVRWPGRTDTLAGCSLTGLIAHLDMAEAFAAWTGDDSGCALDTVLVGGGRDQVVLSHGAWSCQRSLRWDKWLLIRTYHTGLKEFPEIMLFDLEADPHETTNVAGQQPARGRRGADADGRVARRADVARRARRSPVGRHSRGWTVARSGVLARVESLLGAVARNGARTPRGQPRSVRRTPDDPRRVIRKGHARPGLPCATMN